MSKLYDIDKAIIECLEQVDPETGELREDVAEMLAELSMERDALIENLGLFVKELLAESAAIKAEEEALAKRRKAKENRAESLKSYLSYVLNGSAFETPRLKISWRKSSPLVITDEDAVPPEYVKTVTTTAPMKEDIKKAITAGASFDWAYIDSKQNIQIK